MNKKICILTFTICLFFISGCSSTENNLIDESNTKIKVVTTIFPPYDFVRQIGQDNVNVEMLLNPGEESHSYEPTPKDIKNIQSSDIFIYIGGENDVWVDNILSSMGENAPQVLKLLDAVPTVVEEIVEGMEDSHDEEEHDHDSEEHDHTTIDEHVWTSPQNAILIVEKITELLSEKDIENAEVYKENSFNYIKELEELDNKFREVVENGVRKTILFGERFPFRYLADEYGLEYYAAFSGCSTETEASPKTIAFLIDKVKEENLPVVFVIEFSNGKIADSIIEGTDAKKMTLNSCHNLTKQELENGETYLSLMNKNVEALKEALN